jgi:hypothetical protein
LTVSSKKRIPLHCRLNRIWFKAICFIQTQRSSYKYYKYYFAKTVVQAIFKKSPSIPTMKGWAFPGKFPLGAFIDNPVRLHLWTSCSGVLNIQSFFMFVGLSSEIFDRMKAAMQTMIRGVHHYRYYSDNSQGVGAFSEKRC